MIKTDKFKKDDVLLIADFGRSAQGWLSYILSYVLNARYIEPYNLLSGSKYSKSNIIEKNTKGRLDGRETSNYTIVVKTHAFPAKEINLTKSIIYLTRDPRDVAISYYYMVRNSLKKGNINRKLIFHIIPILSYIITAYSWKNHFRSWQYVDSFRLRYEDLRLDTYGTISSVLSNFEVNVNKDIILEAINIFSFENCYGRKRGIEDINNIEARKGEIGDYRNHFTKLHNIIFWFICGKEAKLAGYKFDGSTSIEPKNKN
jgi:hypothetical protein